MPQICHEHCPGEGGSGAICTAAGIVAAAAVLIGAYAAQIADVLTVVLVVLAVASAAGLALLARLLRRHRGIQHFARVASQAETGERRLVVLGGEVRRDEIGARAPLLIRAAAADITVSRSPESAVREHGSRG